MDVTPNTRTDNEFPSKGTRCRAWLTYPAAAQSGKVPLVLMGHGFGATREMRLTAYAERFHDAGFASMIFDYRRFGASDGEPRQLLVPRDQIADWHAALARARSLPGIDSARIALWGTSFAGGLVLSVAARDGNVAATISQCPLLDGRAGALELARYAGLRGLLRVMAHGLWDLALAAIGGKPHYVPIVAPPGELGVMSSADAWEGYTRLAPEGFVNQVTARTGLLVPQHRPLRGAARVKCPALLQLCDRDTVAPAAAAQKAAAGMPRAEVVHYPIGHFDVYVGEDFERSVGDQVGFLRRHLLEESVQSTTIAAVGGMPHGA